MNPDTNRQEGRPPPPGPSSPPSLHGKVALVAGATRGAGRAIALALGEAGATVYCTGRSVRGAPGMAGRPETIHETAEQVTERGGTAIAVRVDHTRQGEVTALVDQIQAETGRLDIVVNSLWGGDPLTAWGTPFWQHSLEDGLRLLDQGVHAHIRTAAATAPLIVAARGIIVEVGDGTPEHNQIYRGNLFYDLAKTSVNRLAFGMAHELGPHGATAIGVTPGFMRSEAMLDHFGVTEANWRDAIEQDPYFAHSESPHYVARAVTHLVADPATWAHGGHTYSAAEAAHRYGFTDADGRVPDFDEVLRGLQEKPPS